MIFYKSMLLMMIVGTSCLIMSSQSTAPLSPNSFQQKHKLTVEVSSLRHRNNQSDSRARREALMADIEACEHNRRVEQKGLISYCCCLVFLAAFLSLYDVPCQLAHWQEEHGCLPDNAHLRADCFQIHTSMCAKPAIVYNSYFILQTKSPATKTVGQALNDYENMLKDGSVSNNVGCCEHITENFNASHCVVKRPFANLDLSQKKNQ